MTNKLKNKCIRCGKDRIISKTEKEHIGNFFVTTITHVCPDPDCQRIVDLKLEKESAKRQEASLHKSQSRNFGRSARAR